MQEEFYFLACFDIKIHTTEAQRRNITLHFAAQYDKLDFGYAAQTLLEFRGCVIQDDAYSCVDYFTPVSNSDAEWWETS